MKTLCFRFLMATLAVVLGTALVRAQSSTDAPPPPPMHGHGPDFAMEHMMGFFAEKLNLTDDQKAQMKAAIQKQRPAMKPLLQQEHQIDLQLRQYVEGTFDQAKVQALAAQKAQIDAQMTVAHAQLHNQLYQMLTADQQSQLKQMEAEHEARMQQHMNQAPPAPPEE